MSPRSRITVVAAPTFPSALKRLSKRYPHIGDDLRQLTDQLIDGYTPGDQIQRTDYAVYKARLPNSDAKRGKSGGYRVIYYLKTAERVLLIYIYSKTDQTDIGSDEIRRMIDDTNRQV